MEIVTLLLAAVALVLSLCSFFFTLTAVCFGASYVVFMRQEIRA